MKRNFLLTLMLLAAASFAGAQMTTVTTDVLGAHLNYGRGCAACHAPHSGVYGNGNAKTADPTSGNIALWGEDVASLYGKTIITGQSEHATYTEVLPSSTTAGTPDVAGILMCLSCHDGNYAKGAMMKNKVYEALPSTYGAGTIPTLLGADGTTGPTSGGGNYLNDHPVGPQAIIGCVPPAQGGYDWDCTSSGGKITMNGAASKLFVQNYGYFVKPANWGGNPTVLCTTCHNQHVMNVVTVSAANSGMPAGTYATMFFLRGPYNPWDQASNQTAQFCRQCHGAESNELNGSTAGTVF
jgi:cytochrome c553